MDSRANLTFKNKSSPTSVNGSSDSEDNSHPQMKKKSFGINRVRSYQVDIEKIDSPDARDGGQEDRSQGISFDITRI